MPIIAADDSRLTWSGALSLDQGSGWVPPGYYDEPSFIERMSRFGLPLAFFDIPLPRQGARGPLTGGVKPWRVPHGDLDLYSPGESGLAERAEMPSGVRLRLATDAEELAVGCAPLAEAGCFDLCIGGQIAATAEYAAGATEVRFAGLPVGEKTVEIWLSPAMPVTVHRIALPEGTHCEKSADTRLKWVAYGSSITHCRTAGSPARTWPGVVARARDFNLTSLGFGGQCHADPFIARLIRDLPADFISVKIGINIYGAASLGPRAFRPAILGTIATIRDGHPHTPFAVCSPIWGHDRETVPNAVGLTLQQMRVEIAEAVQAFKRRGDENIYYIDGLKLFGEELAGHLPDNLHPDATGYERMGENFLREVFAVQGVQVGA